MNKPDLSQLTIDRTITPAARPRRRLWPWLVGAAAVLAAGIAGFAGFGTAQTVETAPVTTAYPSQAVTALNATGYVVAQRKAAIASKATGRLEWLGVAEGSRVKAGEVIARIDNRDVLAQSQAAEAQTGAARAALEQALAEERDVMPLARRVLDANDWTAIEAAFAAHRDPLAGAGTDDYDALFQRIVSLAPAPIGLGPPAKR